MSSPLFRKQLVERYKNNQASDEELQVFFYLLEQGELDDEIFNQLDWNTPFKSKRGLLQLLANWQRVSAAAILLLVITGTYFLTRSAKKPVYDMATATQEQRFKNDIVPGGNKATLTLADGKIITLDDVKNGRLADQGSTTILKVDDGNIAYDADNVTEKTIGYNTINTPRGGRYAVVLPDGSKAWLNAASSIHFPTAFPGNERLVEITGEVYFEVAKDATKPFTVNIPGKTTIEVLGTHFNVNTYENETSANTTLIEGSVKITAAGKAPVILQPGQQAQLSAQHTITILNDINTEDILAWKNNIFYLNKDIQSIMRQVERWYDVEVVYSRKPPNQIFVGKISRDEPVSKLLKILEFTGVIRFSIEGKKITILP